jgi:AraC-like DNA-binding protein
MENKAVPLQEVFGNEGANLEATILEASTTPERIACVEAFLKNRHSDKGTIDRVVKSTVETILSVNGQISIHQLSEQNQVNRRHLERKFSTAIGLSPKQLSKTISLQATLKLLLEGKFNSLTDLAYESDNYDQAHFIKDFREFTGITPREFYRDHLTISSLFYGTGQ